jgi:hypothetical protein
MLFTYFAIYFFIGTATALSICEWINWKEVTASAIVGAVWPIFIASRLIRKIVN